MLALRAWDLIGPILLIATVVMCVAFAALGVVLVFGHVGDAIRAMRNRLER